MKNVIGVIVIYCILFLLQGCVQTGNSVKLRVAVWHAPEEKEIFDLMNKQFKEDNPEIKIEVESYPYGEYLPKILTEFAGKTEPDVILCEAEMLSGFIEKDVLLDLKLFINRDNKEIRLNEIFPILIEGGTINEKVFGLPVSCSPFAIYYNKNMFDKEGIPYPRNDWDFNDLINIGKILTKSQNGRVVQKGFLGEWKSLVFANGGNYVDNTMLPTKSTLDNPRTLEALQFYVDLYKKYQISPTSADRLTVDVGYHESFCMCKVAMIESGLWAAEIFRTKIKNFDWDVVMFPKGFHGERGMLLGSTYFVISKKSKHPQEAWRLIKYLAGTESQRMRAKKVTMVPANKVIAEEEWHNSSVLPANKKVFIESMDFAHFFPFSSRWKEIRTKFFANILEQMVSSNEDISLETELKKMSPEIDRMLQETANR